MSKNMFDLDDELLTEEKKSDFGEYLKKARALCIRGQYDRALEIYNKILDVDYENEEALIGILRVHSKDYREYSGETIENDIHAIETMCPDTYNDEYLKYISKRKDYLSTKKEEKKPESVTQTIKTVVNEEPKPVTPPKPVIPAKPVDPLENLTKLTIADINKYKNDSTFVMPKHVRDIETGLFKNFKNLRKLTLSYDIFNRGYQFNDFFSDNYVVDEVIVPNGVKDIGDFFRKSKNIKKVVLPDSITEVFAFFSSSVEEVNIPRGCRELKTNAFLWCKKLNEITIPDNIKIFGNNVFEDDDSLRKVVFEKNCSFSVFGSPYGNDFFGKCKNIEEIHLPRSWDPEKLPNFSIECIMKCGASAKRVFYQGTINVLKNMLNKDEYFKKMKGKGNSTEWVALDGSYFDGI